MIRSFNSHSFLFLTLVLVFLILFSQPYTHARQVDYFAAIDRKNNYQILDQEIKFNENTKTILYVDSKSKNHPNQHKKQILFVGNTLNEVTWYFQESSVFVSHKSGNQFTIDFSVGDSLQISEKQIISNCQDFEKTIQIINKHKKRKKNEKKRSGRYLPESNC
eukprot:Anaeramoba_flamelloidesa815246_22.p2 GENE.a815246_22~~a815246_22.p2  ORF type:complete len:163 (+),score=28.42 a815246_22:42-530(+)